MTILISTKLRRKLLGYLFANPEGSSHVRGIAAVIDEDPGNLSRELKRLEQEGLLSASVKGRNKLYALNKKYPLYEELKKIIFKTEGPEGALRAIVEKYAGIEKAMIYGSYAKNKDKNASDVDLLIVGKVPHDAFLRDIRQLESKFGREINYTVYSPEEFRRKSGDKGGFLNIVLKDKLIYLKRPE